MSNSTDTRCRCLEHPRPQGNRAWRVSEGSVMLRRVTTVYWCVEMMLVSLFWPPRKVSVLRKDVDVLIETWPSQCHICSFDVNFFWDKVSHTCAAFTLPWCVMPTSPNDSILVMNVYTWILGKLHSLETAAMKLKKIWGHCAFINRSKFFEVCMEKQIQLSVGLVMSWTI